MYIQLAAITVGIGNLKYIKLQTQNPDVSLLVKAFSKVTRKTRHDPKVEEQRRLAADSRTTKVWRLHCRTSTMEKYKGLY